MVSMTVMSMIFILMGFVQNLRQDVTLLHKNAQHSTADDAGDFAALAEIFGNRTFVREETVTDVIPNGQKIGIQKAEIGIRQVWNVSQACNECIGRGMVWDGRVCNTHCAGELCFGGQEGCKDFEKNRRTNDYLCAGASSCRDCVKSDETCMWDAKQSQCYSRSYLNTRIFDDVDIVAQDERRCLDEKSCLKYTGGSCQMVGCKGTRNSQCIDGKCMCKDTDCSRFGKCFNEKMCPLKTGAVCNPFICAKTRKAQCVNDECVCAEGSCAFHGRCWGKAALDLHSTYYSNSFAVHESTSLENIGQVHAPVE